MPSPQYHSDATGNYISRINIVALRIPVISPVLVTVSDRKWSKNGLAESSINLNSGICFSQIPLLEGQSK